jgi:hypothetical protein
VIQYRVERMVLSAMADNCDQEYLRLSLREADGTTKSQIIDNVRTDISPNSLPSLKIVSRGQRNLSSFPKRWPENCPPAFLGWLTFSREPSSDEPTAI